MIRSFMEFLQIKKEELSIGSGKANELIKDLLHLRVGEKLLYTGPFDREGKPIEIKNVNLDVVDSNRQRIHKQFNSVKEAADFIDNIPNLMDGTMEVYFDSTPIYLLTAHKGNITRHSDSDGLIQKIKPMPTDDERWERMESFNGK